MDASNNSGDSKKFLPHVKAMKKVLAESLGVSPDDVGIKATTKRKNGLGRPQGRHWRACSLPYKKNFRLTRVKIGER